MARMLSICEAELAVLTVGMVSPAFFKLILTPALCTAYLNRAGLGTGER